MALFSLALVSVNEARFSLPDLLRVPGDGADAEQFYSDTGDVSPMPALRASAGFEAV
jgi:hypothetical protein